MSGIFKISSSWYLLSFFALLEVSAETTSGLYYGGYTYKQFTNPQRDRILYGHFPANFSWGAATSAHQVEGGWLQGGKGRHIWDTFTHKRKHIFGSNNNADISCDSYHQVKLDILMLKKLGVKHYKFSIAWSRILPNGTNEQVNQAGIDYYQRLINMLLQANIQPMVALYHWDLPQTLDDFGGWSNDHISTYFNDYADICFAVFGGKVKLWITFDEPSDFAVKGHDTGVHAPGFKHQGTTVYRVAHNIIKAHAKAWHTYNIKYRNLQHGQVGITLLANWGFAASQWKDDINAADRYIQFQLGWFAHPLFVDGDYPPVMKEAVLRKSRAQKLTSSRLPAFTESEKKMIKDAIDFIGVDFFSSVYVDYSGPKHIPLPAGYAEDQDLKIFRDWRFPKGGILENGIAPWGIRETLKWIKEQYNNPAIYITANGVAEYDTNRDEKLKLMDIGRIQYHRAHINEVLKAYKIDRVDVRGYTVWTLMDSFEWMDMYSARYGLYYVNFTNPARPRFPRASVGKYAEIIKANGFSIPASILARQQTNLNKPSPGMQPQLQRSKTTTNQSYKGTSVKATPGNVKAIPLLNKPLPPRTNNNVQMLAKAKHPSQNTMPVLERNKLQNQQILRYDLNPNTQTNT